MPSSIFEVTSVWATGNAEDHHVENGDSQQGHDGGGGGGFEE